MTNTNPAAAAVPTTTLPTDWVVGYNTLMATYARVAATTPAPEVERVCAINALRNLLVENPDTMSKEARAALLDALCAMFAIHRIECER